MMIVLILVKSIKLSVKAAIAKKQPFKLKGIVSNDSHSSVSHVLSPEKSDKSPEKNLH